MMHYLTEMVQFFGLKMSKPTCRLLNLRLNYNPGENTLEGTLHLTLQGSFSLG